MTGGEKFAEDRAMSKDTLERARRTIEARSMNDHAKEAAANAEEVIKMLTELWGNHGFTPEQCVFALALVTINFRESLPGRYGGKEMFDRVAHEARLYYDANK